MKEATFWDFKRKLERKKEEQVTGMIDKDGNVVEGREEIMKVYEDFYKNLVKIKVANTKEEKDIEERIRMQMKEVEAKGNEHTPIEFEQEEITRAIRQLTCGKAGDGDNWTNEMIRNGGEEMSNSIRKMYNKISKERELPKQWEKMKIRSIFKNKGSRKEMKNRRGIFLTNIIGKLFEKALKNRIEMAVRIDEHQSGEKKNVMTGDNWIILRAIIDNNRGLRRNSYILMADAEKCFDKLWLQDCLVDMKEAGMKEREIQTLYSLNKRAAITIQTPVRETKEIEVKEFVKQGTVFGPLMCCVNPAQIHKMKEKTMTHITPELSVETLVYVDDILAAGSKGVIEKVGQNLGRIEIERKYTFNIGNGKSHYMIIKTGKKQEEQEIQIQVEKRHNHKN